MARENDQDIADDDSDEEKPRAEAPDGDEEGNRKRRTKGSQTQQH